MKADNDILIVGGSGLIGQKIANDLANDYPDRVIIAGRNVNRASGLAANLGRGIRVRSINVNNRSSVDAALEGVGTVLSCVTQREIPHLLFASIEHGCAYTDIAPMWMHRYPPTPEMESKAVRTGARIIYGAGLVPGISSILARIGADRVGPVDSVASTCLLSAGDEFGPNSRENLQEEFTTSFETTIDKEKVLVWPFTRPQKVEFPYPIGRLTAYLIPFTDQLYYPKTLGARTAVAQLTFLPQWPIRLISTLLPFVRETTAPPRGKKRDLSRLLAWLKQKHKDLDWWGVHVEVRGARGIYRASVQGHSQAQGVTLSALAILRSLTKGTVGQAGIWGAEQVVPIDPFLKSLATYDLVPTTQVIEPAMAETRTNPMRRAKGA